MEQMWNVFSSIGDGPQEVGENRLGLIQSHLKPCLKFIKAIQFNSANIYGAAFWEVLCVLLAVEAFVRPESSAIPRSNRKYLCTASSHLAWVILEDYWDSLGA